MSTVAAQLQRQLERTRQVPYQTRATPTRTVRVRKKVTLLVQKEDILSLTDAFPRPRRPSRHQPSCQGEAGTYCSGGINLDQNQTPNNALYERQ